MNRVQPATAVVGAGAVGCYFGGMLGRAGGPVTVIGRAGHVGALHRDGLAIAGLRGRERVRVMASTELSAVHDAHLILFCVKTTDTESAARAIAPHLNSASVVISMQNGVDNTERIRAAANIRAVAAVVYVAAQMTGAGQVTHSGRGDLVLGRAPSSPAAVDLENIAATFARAEVPCRVSQEIRRELWIKMLMNCAYNAISALTHARYGPIAANPEAREVMRHVIEEAVAVARAEGVALPAAEMIEAAYKLGENMNEALSSTAQDIARGKRTEIASLTGYVARHARQYGIAAPVNETLYALVKQLETAVS